MPTRERSIATANEFLAIVERRKLERSKMEWQEAVTIWTARLSANSAKTARLYRETMQQFFAIAQVDLAAVTLDDLDRVAANMAIRSQRNASRPLSTGTANKYLQIFRVFFRYASRRGWCFFTDEQINDVFRPIPSRVQRPYQILTPGEQDKLIESVLRTQHPKRNLAMVVAMLYAGLRASEVLALCPSDVRQDEHGYFIDVRQGKQRRDRQVPIAASVYEVLQATSCSNDVLMFPLAYNSLFHIVCHAGQRANIAKHVSPHSLRHTFAMDLLRDPTTGQPRAPLPVVAKMLGDTIQAATRYVDHFELNEMRRFAPSFRRPE